MEELLTVINRHYPLNVNEAIKVKNAYKLYTNEGPKCFKASKYDNRQYEFIIKVLSHLASKSFESIPEIQKTIDNKSYIQFGDRFGFLCDWIDSREANFENPIDLRLCVETLAKLHLTANGFRFEDTKNIRYLFGKWVGRFQKRCDELLLFKAMIISKEKKATTEFDYIYLNHFEKNYLQGIRAIKELQASSYDLVMRRQMKESYFCHHDTANHNFLITSELKTYLIDFDYCVFDTNLHDLGSILIRNMRYGNWSISKLEFILETYCKLVKVNLEELQIMLCFMMFPQDFWQIGLQYYVEKKIWTEEVFLKRLDRITSDMNERKEFLSELRWRWSLETYRI